MFKMSNSLFLISIFFIGNAFISQNASADEPKREQPLNYQDTTKWGLNTIVNKLCGTGTQQSPINIDTKKAIINKELSPLKVVYQITNATLMTDGLGAKLFLLGKNELILDGETYRLSNLRWHTPSEHTIDGKKFAAELQQRFIAYDPKGIHAQAIIATVYHIGPPDPIVAAIEPEMAKLAKEMSRNEQGKQWVEEVPVDKFAGNLLNKIPIANYITYKGSLTFPPCSEGVKWFLTDPQTMTIKQSALVKELQNSFNRMNSRPIQPLNGRLVQVNIK